MSDEKRIWDGSFSVRRTANGGVIISDIPGPGLLGAERAFTDLVDCLGFLQAEAVRPEASAPDDDGWIEWHGGECPVPDGTLVYVMFRGSGATKTHYPCGSIDWKHTATAYDIVAYRIAEKNDD